MKGISNYKETEATNFTSELPKLEPGGYIIRVLDIKAEEKNGDYCLRLMLDIAEGEQAGFYKKLYEATPDEWESKKWKGTYTIWIPSNQGDDAAYRKKVGFFKSQLEAFEKSNTGLKINAESDWDERILKGKIVGALFNEKEWDFKGKTGFATQCKRLVPADIIRSGNFTVPKPDLLKSRPSSESSAASSSVNLSDFVEVDVEGVPF